MIFILPLSKIGTDPSTPNVLTGCPSSFFSPPPFHQQQPHYSLQLGHHHTKSPPRSVTALLSGSQALVRLLPAILATASSAVLLADARPAAILAPASLAVVLADARPPPPSLIVTHDPQLYLFWYLCWKIFGWKSAFLSQSRDCLWSSRLAICLFEQGLIHCSESILSWSSIESHKCPLSRWVSQPYFEADAKNEAVATAGSPYILSVFQIWFKGLFKDESGCLFSF